MLWIILAIVVLFIAGHSLRYREFDITVALVGTFTTLALAGFFVTIAVALGLVVAEPYATESADALDWKPVDTAPGSSVLAANDHIEVPVTAADGSVVILSSDGTVFTHTVADGEPMSAALVVTCEPAWVTFSACLFQSTAVAISATADQIDGLATAANDVNFRPLP